MTGLGTTLGMAPACYPANYNGGMLPFVGQCYNLHDYYARYLLQKAMSVYSWEFPEDWSFGLDDYFRYNLYIAGNIPVFWTREYGCIAQWASYRDYNIALRPTKIMVENMFFNGLERAIDVDCVVFSLAPDYLGIWDKIYYYAQLLAEAHQAIIVNLRNSKNPTIYSVNDKKEAEDMKKLQDTVNSGETAVFWKRKPGATWEQFTPDTQRNYITDMLLVDMRKIENRFNTDFGIPNTNAEKKERMNTAEVDSNNGETASWASMTLERLQNCCDKVERMFGTRYIDVDWNPSVNTGNIDMGVILGAESNIADQ